MSILGSLDRHIYVRDSEERRLNMLASTKAKQIGWTGFRLAAVLAGSQLTVAAAKVGEHTTLSGDCGGQSAIHVAITLGQTAWSMVDACVIGQLVHAAGVLLASDSNFSPVRAVAGIIGHEVVAHLAAFVIQVLS